VTKTKVDTNGNGGYLRIAVNEKSLAVCSANVAGFCLFQSREWLQLKVLEVPPELTKLGASLTEASELQRAHDEVLLQLQVQRQGILSRSPILAVRTDGLHINSKVFV
jgi:hypothetical protein